MPTVETESKIVHVACEACVAEAVQAERERCANIAEMYFRAYVWYPRSWFVYANDHNADKMSLCKGIAEKIRGESLTR